MIEPGARRKESAASLKVRCRVTNIPARRGGGGRERSSATSPCASPCAAAAAFLSRILEPRVPLFAPTPCAMDASSCAASLASMAPAGRRGHSKPKRCSKALYYCVPAGSPAGDYEPCRKWRQTLNREKKVAFNSSVRLSIMPRKNKKMGVGGGHTKIRMALLGLRLKDIFFARNRAQRCLLLHTNRGE